ncbi:serine/threonine-protein kinase [Pseudanabaena sp. PCC 6802]|uniref:serine/threonine-protein kinase n=1 Tax=Pseudanabaena sp. PCC 6802 TaxID=118173 RepID=UPI00037CCD68|nr:serine/threonine-protein kinase [Pseudanabaena sp. PCC 6802]
MLCCLNPDCDRPINPDNLNYCQNCGTALTTLLRGRFKVIEPIGRGGFGKTYLAEDTDKLNEHCIVKQLAYQAQGTWAAQKAVELFRQEAQQLQQLGEHPQIPTLLAYFEEGSYLYLVQQFIKGQNLLKELQQNGPFNDAQVTQLLTDILPVLQFTHARGVIHRDIKPENIMRRSSDGKPVLIDFGVAKLISQTVVSAAGAAGTQLGSYGYAPLEQLNEGKASYASDLYALGATCFQLVSGTNPYEPWASDGYTWTSNWRQYVTTPISPQLGLVMDRLLQREVRDRYQSAAQVLQDLQTADTTTIVTPASNPTPPVVPPTVASPPTPPLASPPPVTANSVPPTAVGIPATTPAAREPAYQNYQNPQNYQPVGFGQFTGQPTVEAPKQPRNNLGYFVGLGVAIALGVGIFSNWSAVGLLVQRILPGTPTTSPSPSASPTSSPTTVATSTPTTEPTSTPTGNVPELKTLVKASTPATGTSSPDRFLKVRAENPQPFTYKNGLFEIDIPTGWTLTDNSKSGEVIALWFDSTRNALISVNIFNGDNLSADKAPEFLQTFLRNTFGSKPGFYVENPIVQSDGSTLIVWGYLETIQGATDRIQGNSYIQKVGDKASLLTIGVLDRQFEDLREPMTRVINSYKINESAQIP